MHYVVVACVILHNICERRGEDVDVNIDDVQEQAIAIEAGVNVDQNRGAAYQRALEIRSALCEYVNVNGL